MIVLINKYNHNDIVIKWQDLYNQLTLIKFRKLQHFLGKETESVFSFFSTGESAYLKNSYSCKNLCCCKVKSLLCCKPSEILCILKSFYVFYTFINQLILSQRYNNHYLKNKVWKILQSSCFYQILNIIAS